MPTLYFAEGLPFVIVGNNVAGVALLHMGWPVSAVANLMSTLSLPWVLKPLWSPIIGDTATRRRWIIMTQLIGAALICGLAFAIAENVKILFPVALMAVAFISATHDIAADGFYIVAQDAHTQSEWSGVRNTFYRVAMIAGSGGVVWLAGNWEKSLGIARAWEAAFAFTGAVFGLLAVYHHFILPKPDADKRAAKRGEWIKDFTPTWGSLVQKPGFARMLAFMLFYRFAEGQVQKGNTAFFLAPLDKGGLGLATKEVALLFGTFGVIALLTGGILGGLAVARTGLGRQMWPMCAAMNLPNILYVAMAWVQPQNRLLIGAIVGFEQFGYGYGFAAFMVYLLYVARGDRVTAHYALCTGVMALGLMLGGYVAAEALSRTVDLNNNPRGYLQFFIWVMACVPVSFAVLWKLPLERDFGRRA